MKKKYLVLSLISAISIFLPSALLSAAGISGTWIVDGTYTITGEFKNIEKESTNSFSGKQIVVNSNKTVTIDIGDYYFEGTWKKTGAKKFSFYLKKKKIKNMVKNYVEDNYASYLDNTDLEISVKNYQLNVQILSDGTVNGSGTITAKCKVTYKLGPIEKDIGTADFSGDLSFTGVKQ